MKVFQRNIAKYGLVLFVATLLSACANKPTYVNSHPADTDAQISFGGDTYKGKMLLGHQIPRAFAIALDEEEFNHCEKYDYAVRVRSSKTIWGETNESKQVTVPSGGSIAVMGQYSVIGIQGQTQQCGPLIGIFAPQPNGKYQVDLLLKDGQCRLLIQEQTAQNLVDVDAKHLGKICNRKLTN